LLIEPVADTAGPDKSFKLSKIDPECADLKTKICSDDSKASVYEILEARNYTWILSTEGVSVNQIRSHSTCPAIIHGTLLDDFVRLLFPSDESRTHQWRTQAPHFSEGLFYRWTKTTEEQRVIHFLYMNLSGNVRRPHSYLIADVIAYTRCVKASGGFYLTRTGTLELRGRFREDRYKFWAEKLTQCGPPSSTIISEEVSPDVNTDVLVLVDDALRMGLVAERNLKEGMGLKVEPDLSIYFLDYINYMDPSSNSIAGPLFDATNPEAPRHRLRGPIDDLKASYILSGPFRLALTDAATDHLSFAEIKGRTAILIANPRVIGGIFLSQRIGVTKYFLIKQNADLTDQLEFRHYSLNYCIHIYYCFVKMQRHNA
jgi:hypothetical protein